MSPDTKLSESRVKSLDILRGAIMVLMAIDHVRVYSGVPAGGADPGIFFTRWITHFCAPGFVFFAGLAAFLYGTKIKDQKELIRFLITRGFFLIALEFTLIKFFWTFGLQYKAFTLAGVIWMLGACMILLAPMVRLKPVTMGIIGLTIIFGQELFSLVPKIVPESLLGSFGMIWEFIYPSGLVPLPGITILYVLVPWIGVMAAGYGFGKIMMMEADKKDKLCRWIGLGSILLFLVLGSILLLSKPSPDGAPPFIMRLLNQQKYPASQLYLLMTLGPLIALIPVAEKAKGWLADILTVFGKVPMFYYLLHIPVIHLSALIVNHFLFGVAHNDWYVTAPFTQIVDELRWGLGWLYLVFVLDVGLLYFACKWYMHYKMANREKWWLKYI
jgi:uncharacterized membrane protein